MTERMEERATEAMKALIEKAPHLSPDQIAEGSYKIARAMERERYRIQQEILAEREAAADLQRIQDEHKQLWDGDGMLVRLRKWLG